MRGRDPDEATLAHVIIPFFNNLINTYRLES